MIDENEGRRKTFFQNKFYFTISFVVFFFILFFVFLFNSEGSKNPLICGDGTNTGTCSELKPYFCYEGILIKRASFCGCPDNLILDGDSCLSFYQTEPEEITLNYTLRGEKREIKFVVYKGVVDYLSDLPKIIHYDGNEKPSRRDFKIRSINESLQREFLIPLVVEIQNLAESKSDQARIAISLVQNIPFGPSDKLVSLGSILSVNYSRYPYEVLYEGHGVCGEKSELLVFLLNELGFDTSIFYYNSENHEVVGIKCPLDEGIFETGYCFVETSAPSIITNSELVYSGGIKLFSTPEIIPISEGFSLPGSLYEYEDAEKYMKIEEKAEKTGRINFLDKFKLEELNEKYGISREYRI